MTPSTYNLKVRIPGAMQRTAHGGNSHYAISNVALIGNGNGTTYAAATDGHGMVVQLADSSGVKYALIPADAIGKVKSPIGEMTLFNGQWQRGNRVAPAIEEGTFPKCSPIFPRPKRNQPTVTLDARKLANLQDAMGAESVTIILPDGPMKPMAVLPNTPSGECSASAGVLMPYEAGLDRHAVRYRAFLAAFAKVEREIYAT